MSFFLEKMLKTFVIVNNIINCIIIHVYEKKEIYCIFKKKKKIKQIRVRCAIIRKLTKINFIYVILIWINFILF